MLHAWLAFIPVAALLTVTPGVSTALVVRSAARDGQRAARVIILGNSLAIFAWAVLAAVGVAAVVAASAEAYAVVKLVGAVVLVVLGLQALLRHRDVTPAPEPAGGHLRDGLLTGLANPKLGVFFAALFPQFVPEGAPLLPMALAMAATIVALDLAYFTALAWLVTRARRAFVEGPWARRVEQLTGAVLVGLGVRLALEER
ncbi:MAG TPA: LysE family transporter [Thermoleophilaceae bacterium]|nr:LysE family transporter [Thermoleophilaceae bacterium]